MLYIIPGFGGDHFMAPHWNGPRTTIGRRLHPGDARPRLRHGPPCLCRQRRPTARAARPWSRSLSRYIERTFPAIAEPRARLLERPFLRRLEQSLAPGDLSRLFRRHLVDQPRPGRFPRLSADQPLCAGREHVPGPQGQAPADRADGDDAACSFTTLLAGWTT